MRNSSLDLSVYDPPGTSTAAKKPQLPTACPESGLPILRGRITYDGPAGCQIAIYCDYCRRRHTHGWPERTRDPRHLEHRQCHCIGRGRRSHTQSPYFQRGYLISVDPAADHVPPYATDV